uniref:NADH-ubiquinone oxidoreductase chain 6 n=1 Tax=Chrysochares punctatus TaxID=2741024 RepID=A0A890CGS5_9CUCU|nr:NADH deshydrogenase subunit 6 [Chrysochares punctatus]
MNLMIATMMVFFSTMSMFLNHPVSFGALLIFQTILVAIYSGMMNINFWFSYILFIVMIGGLLILFIYMTSIASNEKFKFSMKFIFIMPTTALTMYFTEKLLLEENFKTYETLIFCKFKMTNLLNKYFNFPFSSMAVFLMMYLLLTMIVVVKLTKKNLGPIRQKW